MFDTIANECIKVWHLLLGSFKSIISVSFLAIVLLCFPLLSLSLSLCVSLSLHVPWVCIQGLALTMQIVYHLSHIPNPFLAIIFQLRFYVFVQGRPQTMIPLPKASFWYGWVYKCEPPLCLLRWGLTKFLPGLDLNDYFPILDLCFPSLRLWTWTLCLDLICFTLKQYILVNPHSL
jgi:hypothetical protein